MLESVLPLRESTFEMRPVLAEAKLDGLKTLEEELPNNTTAIYPGRLGFFFFFFVFPSFSLVGAGYCPLFSITQSLS